MKGAVFYKLCSCGSKEEEFMIISIITNTATTGTTLCHYCYYYNATYRNLQNSIGFKRI